MNQRAKSKRRRFHFKNIRPTDPAIRPFGDWLPENRGFYANFRQWLKDTGYGEVAIRLYAVAARQAIGFIDKPYWTIDPEADIERFWQHLHTRSLTANTLADYHKGLLKLAGYLRWRCHRPPKPKVVNWEYYTGSLPEWLQADIREFLRHCQRNWKPDHKPERFIDLLGQLTKSLRWIFDHFSLGEMHDLTPQVWFAYLDHRLGAGVSPKTTNRELASLKHFSYFLMERDRLVCDRFLLVDYLEEGLNLPKDVPVEQLRRLQQEIQAQASVSHAGLQRLGRMDLAWFLLMLHCGLRTCEVRFMRLQDIDWQARKLRIEQGKGMQDRIVFLSQVTIAALQSYLDVRGTVAALPSHVFIFRHQPLSRTYCFERLRTYSARCNIYVTPHQLRHSCATLLLNSGAPVLTVQTLLGHQRIDTTLDYARLYDGTVAADYYAAMALVEQRLALPEDRLSQPVSIGQLLAMVDAIRQGTLNESQVNLVQQLRSGLITLAEGENHMEDVKVPAQVD